MVGVKHVVDSVFVLEGEVPTLWQIPILFIRAYNRYQLEAYPSYRCSRWWSSATNPGQWVANLIGSFWMRADRVRCTCPPYACFLCSRMLPWFQDRLWGFCGFWVIPLTCLFVLTTIINIINRFEKHKINKYTELKIDNTTIRRDGHRERGRAGFSWQKNNRWKWDKNTSYLQIRQELILAMLRFMVRQGCS